MTKTIDLFTRIGKADVPVKAVVRGLLAIHVEFDRRDAATGKPTYAISHVPTGLRLDGLYKRPMLLKTMLRTLSRLDWSGDVASIRGNGALVDAFIAEVRRVEQCEHWAFRRQMTSLINDAARKRFGKGAR